MFNFNMAQHIAATQPKLARLLNPFLEPEDAPCTVMDWIPKLNLHKPFPDSPPPQSIFTFINNEDYNKNLWELVTRAMPPFFNRKYQNINVEKIIKDYPTDNYLSIMTVYSLWQEALGLPLLNLIHKRHKIYNIEKPKSSPNLLSKDWVKDCKSISKYLQYTWEGEDSKGWFSEDECNNAIEFLFERCIQMQLPWKPILLHQWIICALSQILVFEQDSIELHHVLISEENLDVAKGLINLVRQLKERIMLGFAILNQQVVDHPKISNPKFHHYILDDVVLPSLPILSFICNGTAKKIVDFLKRKSIEGTKLAYLPIETYTMHPELATLHANFMYNFNTWSCKVLPTLFPVVNCDIDSIVSSLKSGESLLNNTEVQVKPLSLEEKCVLKLASKPGVITNQEFKLIMCTIKNKIIKKLPGISALDVEKKLVEEIVKRKSKEYYLSETIKDNVEIALRHGLMYIQVYNMLVDDGKEKEPVVASQLISLQISIIEKVQLARLTHMLRLIFNVGTTSTGNVPAILTEHKTSINNVIEKVKTQNREIFWSQFPVEWKNDVVIKELKCPTPERIEEDDFEELENEDLQDVPGKLIPAFKNRIGRLTYNIAKNSFIKADGGFVLYQYWTFVHNLLPVMVASLLRDYKNSNDCDMEAHNMLDYKFYELLEFIFQIFEDAYGKWMKDESKETKSSRQNNEYEANFHPRQEFPYLNFKLHENARHCIGVELLYGEDVLHRITTFDRILNNLHDFSRKLDSDLDDLPTDFLPLVNKWFFSGYKFTKVLFESSIIAYKLCLPGFPVPKDPLIGDVFFVSSVISELETVLEITKFYRTGDEEFTLEKSVAATFVDMQQLRYEILVCASHPDLLEFHDNLIDTIKPRLLVSYNKLKLYRKACGTNRTPLHAKLLDLLPYSKLQFIPEKFVAAITMFIENDLDELDRMILPVLHAKKPVAARPKKLARGKKKRTV